MFKDYILYFQIVIHEGVSVCEHSMGFLANVSNSKWSRGMIFASHNVLVKGPGFKSPFVVGDLAIFIAWRGINISLASIRIIIFVLDAKPKLFSNPAASSMQDLFG